MDPLLAAFVEHQRRRNLRPNTITRRNTLLRSLGTWLDPVALSAATAGDVEGWLDHLPISPASRGMYLSAVGAFYSWALGVGAITEDPVAKLVRPRLPRRLPRPTPTPDFATAIDAADPQMRAWLLLAGFAGLRCFEIAFLRREDVGDDGEPPWLRVADGKGGHERVVSLHPELLEALQPFLHRRGWLFPSRDNPHYGPSSVSRMIVRHFHLLGIDGGAHRLRHWFGTNVYKASHDLRLTQEVMGHADPRTTALYTLVDASESTDAISSLTLARARHPTALRGVAGGLRAQDRTVEGHRRPGDDARISRRGGAASGDTGGTGAPRSRSDGGPGTDTGGALGATGGGGA